MWYRIGQFILKYRLVLLAVLLAATAVMGYFASKVQLSYDFTKAIPVNNPKYRAYRNLRKSLAKMGTCWCSESKQKNFSKYKLSTLISTFSNN